MDCIHVSIIKREYYDEMVSIKREIARVNGIKVFLTRRESK